MTVLVYPRLSHILHVNTNSSLRTGNNFRPHQNSSYDDGKIVGFNPNFINSVELSVLSKLNCNLSK